MIQEGFMTFYWIRKKVIVDFYISCNATVRNKYVFRYVSDISRINKVEQLIEISYENEIYVTQDMSVPHSSR